MTKVSPLVEVPAPKGAPSSCGLPRRLVVNFIFPQDGPSLSSLASAKTDGACYQLVLYFNASADRLESWMASGSAASQLFNKWVTSADQNQELKERLKLIVRMENVAELGLGSLLDKCEPSHHPHNPPTHTHTHTQTLTVPLAQVQWQAGDAHALVLAASFPRHARDQREYVSVFMANKARHAGGLPSPPRRATPPRDDHPGQCERGAP